MVQLLLDLGASPAQADLHGVTAVHRYATIDQKFLDMLIKHDKPGVQRAVNHMSIENTLWRPQPYTPLLSAIEAKIPSSVLTLLELGAFPEIEFSKFMDAYLAQHDEAINNTNSNYYKSPEQSQRTYHEHVHQPIIIAARAELPKIVLKLLDCGVSPNTLDSKGWQVVDHEHVRRYDHGLALLDVVRQKLKQLRDYKPEFPQEPKEPKRPFEGDGEQYIMPFKSDGYQSWTAVWQVQTAIQRYDAAMKRKSDKPEPPQGLEEKQQAVRSLIVEFEAVEKVLLEKGAKPFYELYPDIQKPEDRGNQFGRYQHGHSQKELPFEIKFSFRVPNLTQSMTEGYIQL